MDEVTSLNIDMTMIEPLYFSKSNCYASDDSLLNLIHEGNYLEILRLNLWIIESGKNKKLSYPSVKTAISERLSSESGSTHQGLLHLYCVGISSLQLFVQRNWVGCPDLQVEDLDIDLDEESKKELILDGECFFPTVKSLSLLMIARCIFHDLREKFPFKLSHWWLLRYVFVHQKVLEETSPTLNAILVNTTNQLPKLEELLRENPALCSLLNLEVGYTYLLYGEVQKAKHYFERANSIADFRIEWTGALGKRTRYQQNLLPQLTVRVHSLNLSSDKTSPDIMSLDDLPSDINLQDDTRLNRIAFLNKDDNVHPDLPSLYQALIISQATQLEKFHPKDELLAEELTPLLNCVLSYPKIWCLHFSCLLIRSKLESNQSRAIERSMMQLQQLVDSLPKTNPILAKRMAYFYVSRMPLEWELQGTLADVFLSLGAVSSALDIYVRLQMWDKVIGCYQQLEMKHKAEEIVRQELAKEETPKLWCLLGDCTDDVTCYEKAWDLSKHTSARAQRDWAYYFYRKKQYRECIPHFQRSLAVNSLQEGIWIRLAFSAMEIEDWDTAAGAYRRFCALNSESFEAWNNVAKCYTKLGQKARAWKALLEAVKCQYENWKVWDNLMVVSIDCCEYEEAIRSYNRILDLKDKHVDNEVLRILVHAVAENKEDNYGHPAARLATSVQKLLGRLTSQVTNNAQLWEIYSDLITATEKDAYRVAQLSQKALRSAVQEKNWEKDVHTCIATLKTCNKFLQNCLALLEQVSSKENLQLINSAKLSLRSTISTVRLCYPLQIPDSIQEHLSSLEMLQNDLVTQLSMVSS